MAFFKTSILMFSIICLFVFSGYIIAGEEGMLISLIFGILSNVFAYWYSDKVVLAIYKAKRVHQGNFPELFQMISELTVNANLTMPAIYVVDDEFPNAFATGRDPSNAAIAVTRGLMKRLTENELKGVLAHELAHIMNRDILIATVSAVFAAAISSLASFALIFGSRGGNKQANPIVIFVLALITPLAATVIQMAISRSREYEADRIGALLTKDPLSLASALNKIDCISKAESFTTVQQHPETAQMMIVSPLLAKGLSNLFSTHPPTPERISRLRRMTSDIRDR